MKLGVGYWYQGHTARILELLGGSSKQPGGKAVNLTQGRSNGDSEEKMDPRDS